MANQTPTDLTPPDKITHDEFAAALQRCESEPIHTPGAIQPHGVLLGIQPTDEIIVQVSANTAAHLGVSPFDLLGKPLRELLGEAQTDTLQTLVANEQFNERLPLFLTIPVRGETGHFLSLLHLSEGLVILELEPYQPLVPDALINLHYRVNRILAALRQASSLPVLYQTAVEQLRTLTGFDQMVLYQLLEDNTGHILAESRADHMPTYLDLHFPATDFPEQSRANYRQHRVRLIPDYQFTPVPLIPANHPLTGQPLDLRHAVLRSVHRWCVEYYQNMGTQAAMVIAIVDQDRLWGMFSCHHATAHYVGIEIREAVDLIAQMFASYVRRKVELEQEVYRGQLQMYLDRLLEKIEGSEVWQEGLLQDSNSLLQVVACTGAAVCVAHAFTTVGDTPPLTQIQTLCHWLDAHGQRQWSTDRLMACCDPAITLDGVAGVLAIAISEPPGDWLIWFRPEIAQTVKWAGKPEKKVQWVDEQLLLSPRSSFNQWVEEARGRSLPFQPMEQQMALLLRNAILKRVLHLSRLRERTIVMQLIESQKRLDELLASLRDMVWSMSWPEGRLLYVSPPATAMTGWSVQSLLEDPQLRFNIIHPQDRSYVQEALHRALHTETFEIEYRIVRRDGPIRWIKDRGKVVRNGEGLVIRMDGIASDITAQKQAEEAVRQSEQRYRLANDELKNFTHIVSHDLKAPIANLNGLVGELKIGLNEMRSIFEPVIPTIDAPLRRRLQNAFDDCVESTDLMEQSGQKMARLLEVILGLSRLGRRKPVIQRVDVNVIVERVLQGLTYQMEQADAELEIRPLPILRSDPDILELVIGNLFANAIKYRSPQRRLKITCWAEASETETTFHLQDNGRGISETDLGKIFKLFQRVGEQDQPGEGVGLSYVRTVLARFGGSVWATSQLDVGSTFSFRIPNDWSPYAQWEE